MSYIYSRSRKQLMMSSCIEGYISFDNLENLCPYHKIISDFRKDNKKAGHMEYSKAELDKYLTQLQEKDIFDSVEEQLTGLSEELGVETILPEKIASLQAQVEDLTKYKQLLKNSGRDTSDPFDSEIKIIKTSGLGKKYFYRR
ncbi:MAG: hypothetical protein ACOYEG_00390 [Petrimonas sp.]